MTAAPPGRAVPDGLGAGMAATAGSDSDRRPGSDAGDGSPTMLDPGLTGSPARPAPGIDNGYLAGYRVRFDEAGADGHARTSSLLRYAQDIAWRHSEDRGFDRQWYADRARWWVVRSVLLDVLQPVAMGRTLRLETAVIGHRRIWARRLGEFHLPDGTLAAVVNTDWVLLDDRGRIIRIPDDFGSAFPNPEIGGEIIRVQPPATPTDVERLELSVRPQDLDPMGHVNNGAYLDWIEEGVTAAGDAAAAGALPRRVAIEYAASAEPGSRVHVSAWRDGERAWWIRITGAEDGADRIRARVEAPSG
ncbi:MAG: acyl-ACP thioesterase domain-containing protein [Candidatus Limnocylindrales bacterium]